MTSDARKLGLLIDTWVVLLAMVSLIAGGAYYMGGVNESLETLKRGQSTLHELMGTVREKVAKLEGRHEKEG